MANPERVACEVCGREVQRRYTSLHPDTGQLVRACNHCDCWLAQLRDRRAQETLKAKGEKVRV